MEPEGSELKIEARQMLLYFAKISYNRGNSYMEFKDLLEKEKHLSFYISIIGLKELEHMLDYVWHL